MFVLKIRYVMLEYRKEIHAIFMHYVFLSVSPPPLIKIEIDFFETIPPAVLL